MFHTLLIAGYSSVTDAWSCHIHIDDAVRNNIDIKSFD